MKSVCFSNIKIDKINKHCYNKWLVVYEFRTHIWIGGHERWVGSMVSGIRMRSFCGGFCGGIKLKTLCS